MAGTPAELLLHHFEKLVLAGLCLGVGAAWGFASPDPSASVAALDQKRMRVDNHMRNARPEEELLLDRPHLLEERLNASVSTEALPPWLMHRRPGLLTEERPWRDLQGELGQLALEAKLLPRGVRLSWKEPSHSEFLLLSYRLERQLDGGEWQLLTEPEAAQRSFEDATLPPRVEARYRLSVAAKIDASLVARYQRRRERLELPKSERARTSDPTPAQKLRQDVFLVPRTVWEPNALAGTPGRAYVTVYVRNPDGSFRKKGFPVSVGAPIGEEVAVGRETVDYRSQAVLLEVRQDVTEGPQGRKQTRGVIKVRWPGGQEEEITTQVAPPR